MIRRRRRRRPKRKIEEEKRGMEREIDGVRRREDTDVMGKKKTIKIIYHHRFG
jgi:hypothetical protein